MAALGLSRYAAFGVSFLVSIVQKGLLGPYLVGVWQLLSIARQYLGYSDLGVARGAERKLPPLYAQASEQLESVKRAGYTFTLAPVLAINSLVIVATFVWPAQVDPVILWGFRGMAIVAILESAANIFEGSVLRSPARFRLVSLQVLGSELLFAAVSIPSILLWGVYGLIGAAALSMLFKLTFMRVATGEWFHFQLDLRQGIALWRVGFPVTVYVILFKTIELLDRLLLLHAGELELLGYYSIATMATVLLGHLPLVISQAFFPRTMTWVETRDSVELSRYFRQAQLCIVVVMGAAVGACYFVLPVGVAYVLPAFTPGIDAMKIAVFSAVFVGLVHVPIQYQIGWNRQWPLVALMAATTAVYYGFGLLGVQSLGSSEATLVLVAWSRVIGFGVLTVTLLWWTLRRLGSDSTRVEVVELAGVAAYLAILIVGIDLLLVTDEIGLGREVLGVGASLALFGLGLWPVVRFVDRRTGVLTLIKRLLERKA
jgi:O-antigen/teichoic acid export membrane protein